MMKFNGKELGKKQLAIVLTAASVAILTVVYVILNALIGAGVFDSEAPQGTSSIELKDGESTYNNMAVVYPYIAKSSLISIAVSSHKDSFVMSRPEGDNGYEGHFTLYYQDDNGELQVYYPGIMAEEGDVDYSDFYAIEKADGLNLTKIDYVCAAVGALYFDRRIEPEEDYDAQLNRYGLSREEREVVYFTYLDSKGQEREMRIFIGDKLISGVGYYFMIEGRDYIYTSLASDRFGYLLGDFESFLHSRITAEGRPADGLYEPYLTTDYKQWTNKYYGINSGGIGLYPTAGSEVVVSAEIRDTLYEADGDGDGYLHSGYDIISIDMSKLTLRPEMDRLAQLIKNTAVGDYSGNEKVATVITNVNEAKLGKQYSYEILRVESVLSSDGEHFEVGYRVGENNLVKVEYLYRLDGEPMSDQVCHGVIDLDTASAIPDEIIDRLRQSYVGESFGGLSFSAVYSEENSVMRKVDFIITDILLITKLGGDGSITYLDKITEDSIVTYNYKYVIDGYEVGEEGREMVDLSAITEGDSLKIKNALIGLGLESGMDLLVYEHKVYCQPLMDFLTYSIRTVKGFVEKEAVVSFEFVNQSERDPFYAESIYKNTLENENRFYALDALACQNVTFLLGGVGSGYNSQVSAGLSGSETVAVGLTPANMDRYGLYDGYTVYFELPRDIAGISGTDDFTYLSTLGCYLYISKTNTDGYRYVGSTLYDIIVKIDGALFDYLEKSFDEYWARRNLVMVNYTNLNKVTLDFNMTDVFGSYEFDLEHKLIYISGNEHYDQKPEGDYSEYNFLTVTARPLSENMSDSFFKQVLENEGRESITLANLFNRAAGKPVSVGHDTAGSASFKSILSLMYGTNYEGMVTAEEASDAFDNAPKVMSVSFYLNSSTYGYTYDFYRISDRRVMVHIYRVDQYGNATEGTTEELSGFYISNFGFKKIANAFISTLNGVQVDPDQPF